MPLLPYQRREVFLEAIKNRQTAPLDPNNREELFLKAIADNVHGTTPGVPVPLSYDFYEKLINLPEAHTHTERYYRDILGSLMVADDYVNTDPYLIRGTADHHAVSGDARLKKLGNTVCVNQLVKNGDFSDGTDNWSSLFSSISASDGEATVVSDQTNTVIGISQTATFVEGHYILVSFFAKSSDVPKIRVRLPFQSNGADLTSAYKQYFFIGQAVSGATSFSIQGLKLNAADTGTYNVKDILSRDITLWYGSNDRIPSDLLSHPENWGRYYAGSLAYNAGTLDSADGSILTSLPRNGFDKSQTMVNAIVGTDGSYTTNANAKSIWMPCIPNTEYHFFKSKGARFNAGSAPTQITSGYFSAYGTSTSNNSFTITTGASDRYILVWFYNSAIDTGLTAEEVAATVCVSLYYPGESGYDQHYPFSVLAEVDTGSEVLRGVEGGRDEKLPSGAIKRNRAVIDLGTLNYQIEHHATLGDYFYVDVTALGVKYEGGFSDVIYSGISSRYTMSQRTALAFVDKSICFDGNQSLQQVTQIQIKDSAYNDAAAFKTSMSGVYLEYPLATPTTEQGSPFSPTYGVEYGGQESWLTSNGIPQGHETTYTIFKT